MCVSVLVDWVCLEHRNGRALISCRAFVIFVGNLFNENSKFGIVKKKKKPFKQISKNEYLKALKIQELYELQHIPVKK